MNLAKEYECMKKYIGTICWLVGAVIWLIVSRIYLSDGKAAFAIVQVVIVVLMVINAIRSYLKQKKSE